MATVKDLEEQVNKLNARMTRLQTSNSELKDELVVMKKNYSVLVKEVSERLEAIHTRFQKA